MIKVLNAAQIRAVDKMTIAGEGIVSAELMERASRKCALWIFDFYGSTRPVFVFAGPGNNGGDGLAVARILVDMGLSVRACLLERPEKLSPDCHANFVRLKEQGLVPVSFLDESPGMPSIPETAIVIDALFGSGLSRPLFGRASILAGHINGSLASVVSIDIPSGLFPESNSLGDAVIRADITLTFQFPKLSFFFAENGGYVGVWHVLDISLSNEAIDAQQSACLFTEESDIGFLIQAGSRTAAFAHALSPGSVVILQTGEFDLLAGPSSGGYERYLRQIQFAEKYGLVVVLPGAFTSVVFPRGMCVFIRTDNPGLFKFMLLKGCESFAAALMGVHRPAYPS